MAAKKLAPEHVAREHQRAAAKPCRGETSRKASNPATRDDHVEFVAQRSKFSLRIALCIAAPAS
ncbi:MAG: hypothetical protein WBD15_20270, partial [Pseudolabrys sp.]